MNLERRIPPGGDEALVAYEAGLAAIRKCRDVLTVADRFGWEPRSLSFALAWLWMLSEDELGIPLPLSEMGAHLRELVELTKPYATYDAVCSMLEKAWGERSKKGTLPEGG